MKIVSIISARGGSKSIPDKNIIQLGAYPLIVYSIATAKMSNYIKDVIVTTDSEKIASISKKYKASVPFLRPKEISQDNSLDIDFFKHYLNYLDENSMDIPDLIVHLRPTTPLRNISVVDKAIEFMINNTDADSLRSMTKTHLTPYKMFREEREYAKPFLDYDKEKEFYNFPRQHFCDTYLPNGYVDIIRPCILKETGLLHGDKMKIWETDITADIDVLEDYDFCVKLLKEKRFESLIYYLGEYCE